MQSSSKGFLFMISVVATIFSSLSLFFLIFTFPTYSYSLPGSKLATKDYASTKITSGLPFLLTISKIKVSAFVDYVGLTSAGAMDIGKGPAGVSWYNLGPRPGHVGSAVIAGHNGIRKNGDVSVFHNLDMLRKGDIVSVNDDKGEIISFIVREIKIYKKTANTLAVFSSNDGKAHLNLITCVFDPISKTYPSRLVVFTDKILH